MNSAITVDLNSGSERGSQRLTRADPALFIRAGVWRLREFSQQTKLVVLSSKPFGDVRHFERPEPTLLDDIEP